MSEVTRPRITSIADLRGLIGSDLEPSPWLTVTQEQVNTFAEATLDRQWIHLDEKRAAFGPYGATVAHGYLVLSLGPHLVRQVLDLTSLTAGINYGLNRLRFPAPTPVGSRVRLRVQVVEVLEVADGARVTMTYTFERDGGERPVCVAEVVSQLMFGPADR